MGSTSSNVFQVRVPMSGWYMNVLQYSFYTLFALCGVVYFISEYSIRFPLSSLVVSYVYALVVGFLSTAIVWSICLYGKRSSMSIDHNRVVVYNKDGLENFNIQRLDIKEISFIRRPWLLHYIVRQPNIERRNLTQPFDRLVLLTKDDMRHVVSLPLDSIFSVMNLLKNYNYPIVVTDKIYRAWEIFGIGSNKKIENDISFKRKSIYWFIACCSFLVLLLFGRYCISGKGWVEFNIFLL